MVVSGSIPAQPTQQRYQRNGLIIAVCAAFLFSTKPIFIKYLYSLGMEPLPLMWLRMMLALPVYIVVGIFASKSLISQPTAGQCLTAAGIGLLGYYLASYLDLLGLQYVSAQFERVILYAYPSFVVIIGGLFFAQPLGRRIILPLVLTYGGLVLMYAQDMQLTELAEAKKHQWGVMLILASALSFSLYILFSKKAISTMGSVLFTSIAMGAAALATALHQGVENSLQLPQLSSNAWIGVFALTLLATVLPSFLTSEAIKRIGPAKASMTGTLGPVATTIMAIVWLDEGFSLISLAGMALVILGVSRLAKK